MGHLVERAPAFHMDCEFTGERLPALISDLTFVVIEGGPHAIAWTHADQVNAALADFLK